MKEVKGAVDISRINQLVEEVLNKRVEDPDWDPGKDFK